MLNMIPIKDSNPLSEVKWVLVLEALTHGIYAYQKSLLRCHIKLYASIPQNIWHIFMKFVKQFHNLGLLKILGQAGVQHCYTWKHFIWQLFFSAYQYFFISMVSKQIVETSIGKRPKKHIDWPFFIKIRNRIFAQVEEKFRSNSVFDDMGPILKNLFFVNLMQPCYFASSRYIRRKFISSKSSCN